MTTPFGSYFYSWEWRLNSNDTPRQREDQNGGQNGGKPGGGRSIPPPPPTSASSSASSSSEELKWDTYDLTPTHFQNYLLDLVTLANIYLPVGLSGNPAESPVANWLRTQGLTLRYEEHLGEDDTYLLLDSAGHEVSALPGYLVRYLELLALDPFSEDAVPAYQALALLTYVLTTERYDASGF